MKKIVTLLKVRIVTIFALRGEIHMDQSFHYLSMVMYAMGQKKRMEERLSERK